MWTERQPGRRAAYVPCDEGAGRPPAESAPARGPHSVQGDRCTSCPRSSQAPGCNRSPVGEEALEDEMPSPLLKDTLPCRPLPGYRPVLRALPRREDPALSPGRVPSPAGMAPPGPGKHLR